MPIIPSDDARAQIEVHCLHLRAGQPLSDRLLSPAETRRAAAFRCGEAARLFVAGRVLCRSVIAGMVDCAPEDLRIAISPEGRPYLPDHPGVDFNLSHTTGTVALAVCRGSRVGIDIERAAAYEEAALRELMPLVLCESQMTDLRKLPPSERSIAALALWVGQEAVLQCRGRGLLDDPRQVLVGAAGTPLDLREHADARDHRHCFHAGSGAGYLWAVATEQPTDAPVWQHHAISEQLMTGRR